MLEILKRYRNIVFDCDGVVLDSNKLKTEAFYQAGLVYGKAAAEALVRYHQCHGGISRYIKFEYFLSEIVARPYGKAEMGEILSRYANLVSDGLLACTVAPGLSQLRKAVPESRWMIVSGGDQGELRRIFINRGLDTMFDCGIFGSPDPKNIILAREQKQGNLVSPSLFIGDSLLDYQCAVDAGLDFIFLSDWTEFLDWPAFFSNKSVVIKGNVAQLLD